MSYPRFFVDRGGYGQTIALDGESAKHISKSLRMKPGEKIIVCDPEMNEYECEICGFTPEKVTAKIVDVRRNVSEPEFRAVVYQACPKSDKMDYIIQKAVELGASEIVAFLSDRCVVRYDGDTFEKKLVRWNRIALEAAKQSGRGRVPTVRSLPDLKSVVSEIAKKGAGFICYENENSLTLRKFLSGTKGEKDVSFIIGSEGGFSEDEARFCLENGIQTVGLGRRILRTETASGFVLSCLAYEKEL